MSDWEDCNCIYSESVSIKNSISNKTVAAESGLDGSLGVVRYRAATKKIIKLEQPKIFGLEQNKLAKLRRHASRVHFTKIHLR